MTKTMNDIDFLMKQIEIALRNRLTIQEERYILQALEELTAGMYELGIMDID